MPDDDRKTIVENRPRFHRLSRRAATALWVAGAIAIGLTAAVLVAKHGSPPGPTGTKTSDPSTQPRIENLLVGKGPLIVYEVSGELGEDPSPEFLAIDLGRPGSKPIRLGSPPGEPFSLESSQAWGESIPIITTTYGGEHGGGSVQLWTLTRGRGFDDHPIVIQRDLVRALASFRGKEVLILTNVPGRTQRLDALLVTADGSSKRQLVRMYRGGSRDEENEEGAFTPIAALANGDWLGFPICQCDYALPMHWHVISASGSVSIAEWLGRPTDDSPSVSANGRYISLVDEPRRDCSTRDSFDTCPDGLARLLVADTVTRKVRSLARYRNTLGFGPTKISPDGTRVAANPGGSYPLYILDTSSGEVVATVDKAKDMTPVAFIDNTTLLVANTVGAAETTKDELYLVRLGPGRPVVTRLTEDFSRFWGWIR